MAVRGRDSLEMMARSSDHPRWVVDAAQASLDVAVSPRTSSARADPSVWAEVVTHRHLFGAAAGAVAAGQLLRAADRDDAFGEAAADALRRRPLGRRGLLRGIARGAVAVSAAQFLTACELVLVPSPLQPAGGFSPSSNLLQIVVDDLNEYVGFLGGYPGAIHTPNLDALAAESLSFDQFHIAVPICPPSRATLLWGVDAPTHGIYRRTPDLSDYYGFAASNPQHIVQVLADAGFTQFGGGKVFHGQLSPHVAIWDEYFANSYASASGPAGPDLNFFDYGTLPAGADHPDALLADFIIDKMQLVGGISRFNLTAGFRLPHLGWVVPQEYLDLYPLNDVVVHDVVDDWDDLGPIGRASIGEPISLFFSEPRTWLEWVILNGDRQVYLQHYLASISFVDHQIGRLLNELAAQPYADDTVVTLVSDNGYHHGENGAMRKGMLRDQSTRVPFLIRHPDLAPEVFTTPVGSLNYATTLLGLLGVAAPAGMEGANLVTDLPTGFISSYFRNSDLLSTSESVISTNAPQLRWVFHHVEPGHPNYDDGPVPGVAEAELYDRSIDPHETVNLLAGL